MVEARDGPSSHTVIRLPLELPSRAERRKGWGEKGEKKRMSLQNRELGANLWHG